MDSSRVPLVHLCDSGPTASGHDLLASDRRVVALQTPESAQAALDAVSALGIDQFDLLGTSAGATAALRVALVAPGRVRALVLESPAVPPDAELAAALPGLPVPVLVLVGTGDAAVPPDTGRALKELLPSCQLLFVYDAGRAVAADRPEAFAEAVSDFLERHEQFVVSRRSSVLFP